MEVIQPNPEPTVTCSICGKWEDVRPDGRGYSPDIARRRLSKRCGHPTSGMIYRAGIIVGRPAGGQ
jgi:hypothetical protein